MTGVPAPLDLRPQTATAVAGTNDPRPASQPPALSWTAPEYLLREKSVLWYAGFGVLMALLLFAAFLMRSFLSGVVFALLGTLVLLYSERPPRSVRFSISRDHLTINDRRYVLRDLDRFNIIETPTHPQADGAPGHLLLIRGRRTLLPLLHLPLAADVEPETVRRALRRLIKEDADLREPLADLVAHGLGF